MADSIIITSNVTDGAVITSNVSEATVVTANVVPGAKGDKGDKGDVGTTDYNELVNTPDLTLKADKSDTYTKIEVDTSLAGKAELVHVHAISDVTGLQTALDGKSATGHTHTAANITDFDAEVSNNTDVAANTAARHTHANSAVLDATTASFTTADETKLDGIAAGAQVNTVTSVNTRTGAVTGLAEASDLTAHTGNTSNPHSVTKAQVGLSNADNTSDVNKPISTATQTALDGKFTQRTITGTANQITVTNGDGVSGNPTLSLPQNIHTGASPTFATPTAAGHAAIKSYVDTFMPKSANSGNPFTATLYTRAVQSVADSTYDLGSSLFYWSNTYTDRITINSTAYIDGASAGILDITGKVKVTGVQAIYVPDQTNFTGSMFFGGGGTALTYVSGDDGRYNLGVGKSALNSITRGKVNVALGFTTLANLTTGNSNMGIGEGALNGLISGSNNIGIGAYALYSGTGTANIGIGSGAGNNISSGGSAILIGHNAGRFIADGTTATTTLNDSVIIGNYAYPKTNADTNETVIGYTTIGNGSNTVTIGNTSVTANYFNGNIESATTSAGVILKSPDGTRYKVTVANGGTIAVAAA